MSLLLPLQAGGVAEAASALSVSVIPAAGAGVGSVLDLGHSSPGPREAVTVEVASGRDGELVGGHSVPGVGVGRSWSALATLATHFHALPRGLNDALLPRVSRVFHGSPTSKGRGAGLRSGSAIVHEAYLLTATNVTRGPQLLLLPSSRSWRCAQVLSRTRWMPSTHSFSCPGALAAAVAAAVTQRLKFHGVVTRC